MDKNVNGTDAAAQAQEKATQMTQRHGPGAARALVVEIEKAVRSGDDEAVTRLDRALRIIESRPQRRFR